ncbi:MAG: transporter substrate-binding domain-containing protein [Clostridia bacterium]|nr:transporter substrate-binding domain-containing protein [Clostridia bacterium]
MKKLLAMIMVLALAMTAAAVAETLKMGCSADFPPYEYYDDETGDVTGLDVEIADAVCKLLGYDGVEVVDMAFDSVITAVTSGKVDFGMSGMTVTEDRKLSVDFTVPYQTAVQAVLILKEGSSLTSADDLFAEGASHKVGVQNGTTGDLYATDDLETPGLATMERYTKYSDGVVALMNGKIDCMILDDQVAYAFAAENEQLAVLDTDYWTEEYACCFPLGSELGAQFSDALQTLIDDGTVAAIIEKYIPAEEAA